MKERGQGSESKQMKKYATFALLICILVLGVAAVLSVKYPELQVIFAEWVRRALSAARIILRTIVRAFQIAFKGQ